MQGPERPSNTETNNIVNLRLKIRSNLEITVILSMAEEVIFHFFKFFVNFQFSETKCPEPYIFLYLQQIFPQGWSRIGSCRTSSCHDPPALLTSGADPATYSGAGGLGCRLAFRTAAPSFLCVSISQWQCFASCTYAGRGAVRAAGPWTPSYLQGRVPARPIAGILPCPFVLDISYFLMESSQRIRPQLAPPRHAPHVRSRLSLALI